MSSVLKSGSKIEEAYNYIKREMVGSELFFNSESASKLAELMGSNKREYAWNIIIVLRRKGLITTKKLGHHKGMSISFPKPGDIVQEEEKKKIKSVTKIKSSTKKDKSANSDDPGINSLIEQIKAEIDALNEKLAERKKLYDSLIFVQTNLKKG